MGLIFQKKEKEKEKEDMRMEIMKEMGNYDTIKSKKKKKKKTKQKKKKKKNKKNDSDNDSSSSSNSSRSSRSSSSSSSSSDDNDDVKKSKKKKTNKKKRKRPTTAESMVAMMVKDLMKKDSFERVQRAKLQQFEAQARAMVQLQHQGMAMGSTAASLIFGPDHEGRNRSEHLIGMDETIDEQ